MKKVEAIVSLILIDGVTYQIALPKNIVALQAKQALVMAQEFGGKIIPCDFASIKPMDADGMPFNINDSGAENES
ncbi:Uncharacterised protein [Morganella morganii]|uniref:hypothetical protein n=1 Tax=Morganella morganii TaxID=582 RepID=UPI000D93E593|nr:hypothetical protein [Morganella morganii]SPX94986.1 Uncharacterised protein [Morganella morganii]